MSNTKWVKTYLSTNDPQANLNPLTYIHYPLTLYECACHFKITKGRYTFYPLHPCCICKKITVSTKRLSEYIKQILILQNYKTIIETYSNTAICP